jgi:hypothetical protein
MTLSLTELKNRHRAKQRLTAKLKKKLFERYHREWWLAPPSKRPPIARRMFDLLGFGGQWFGRPTKAHEPQSLIWRKHEWQD